MFAVLGDIEFELLVYWDGFDATFGMDYAEHARIEGKPGLQFIGEKLDEVSISLVFHDHYCQPDVELARLRDAMVAHQALALVFGNGDYRGWFVITAISATSEQTDAWGNVQALSATLTLREYIGDPKNPLTPPAVSGDDPNIDAWGDGADDGFPGSDMFDGLSDVAAGMGEASSALDSAGQMFDELSSSASEMMAAADELASGLDDVLSPLDEVTQALEGITDGGALTDSISEVWSCASRVYDAVSGALGGFEGADEDNIADVCSQAFSVVQNCRSLMADCSPSVSRLAAAIILRSV
ncbi:phage tail protein [Salmonella enterica]|uniref:phage tail protein n=3 Tax=Salmonella enterica TaxID=28901 RepID=UPI0021D4B05E|nr:phage tail protein [Salmonella enterica]MCU7097924.1 phage tail protein [Salmonella enterica]MCU7116329.1 phage tail protein [Salmonella enterica]